MSIKRLSGAGLTTPKSNKLWDQTTFQSGMFALATVSLTTATSTVTFASIPSNYSHLQVRLLTKESGTGTGGPNIVMKMGNGSLNSTYTDYRSHYLGCDGSTPNAGTVQSSGYFCLVGNTATNNASYTSMYGGMVLDILDYTSTTKHKVVRSIWGHDRNGSGETGMDSSMWFPTSIVAVDTISFSIVGGTNFMANSHFALYGIKAG